ncbi:MAG TPA: bifunctional UDP-sugar hydrolase/5'-nucleotidase [Kofleriaceae bacterium]|nr:bifunctional UDP-sugar hydrolase/5'-nucleotidase [Kofleriaceae bacterium]
MISARRLVWILLAIAACASPPAREPASPTPPVVTAPAPAPAPQLAPRKVTLTIVGTNDVHGALERLPIFAGFVANMRAARAADGGGVIVLDGGDMFQGTLESNLGEGADLVRAYNQIGYAAAAVGNHEFDFGPAGPLATPASAADDPRGALLARAAEAKFPFVSANLVDVKAGAPVRWPNVPASTLIEVAGVRVGIVGASTESTPYTTMAANFAGLAIAPTAAAIAEEARRLRAGGARVVIVAAHIGGRCRKFEDPDDLSSCDRDEELFRVVEALPPGTIDVFVGGHTHQAMAHRVAGVAVIEAYASGRAFGRVDLEVSPEGRVSAVKIHKPHVMCGESDKPVPVAACRPGDYEGRPVVPDPAVQRIVDEALARAAVLRSEKLGVKLLGPVTRSYSQESAIGNWMSDLMLVARPDAQVSLTNGGGLRADLPAGELEYGQLYEVIPFDNRFAIVEMKGAHLRSMVTSNLTRGGAILSWGGLAAKARCKGDRLDVKITVRGKPLADGATYKVATSDFLASGGDGLIGRLKLPDGSVKLSDVIIRDGIADVLRKRKGAIDPARLYSATVRRLDYEGRRPVECGAPPAGPPTGGGPRP